MEFCLNGTADTSLADGPVTEVYLPDCQTKCYVMWGVGPSTHGIGSTGRVVTELRNAGMKTVVIDPRLTPDAARARRVAAPFARAPTWPSCWPGCATSSTRICTTTSS